MPANELARWRDRHANHPVRQVELETGGLFGGVHVPRLIRRGLECSACEEVSWLDEVRPDEAFS